MRKLTAQPPGSFVMAKSFSPRAFLWLLSRVTFKMVFDNNYIYTCQQHKIWPTSLRRWFTMLALPQSGFESREQQ